MCPSLVFLPLHPRPSPSSLRKSPCSGPPNYPFCRGARDLISKIRSCTVRSDLKNKAFSAVFCLFLRSDLTVQDRTLEIRSLASLGFCRGEATCGAGCWGGVATQKNKESTLKTAREKRSAKGSQFCSSQNPDLLFLASLENSKENHQKGRDFFCLPNP